MRKKKYFYFGFFVVALLYIYFANVYTVKAYNRNFIKFNQSNLDDSILKSDVYAKGVRLILKEDTLIFYPVTSGLNGNNIFEYIAKKGDSVIKKPFQDTLVLKKMDGSIYRYTFMKP